ncbi:hypothetical protein ACQP0C_02780 [Nocardia sp. CA-129566]|uniref:hypothetical protein n=1 Tax=Nocardia sp. CA-129566 TaxID=3239976 RepID=UPI003D96DBF6
MNKARPMPLRQLMRQLHVREIAQRLRHNEYLSPGRATESLSVVDDFRVDLPTLVVDEGP